MPMGVTSENVAAKYGIDRKTQDAFSVRSHQKAAAARAAGRFKDEIVPVHTKVCFLCACGLLDSLCKHTPLTSCKTDHVSLDTQLIGP
jgi:hypothetical protein